MPGSPRVPPTRARRATAADVRREKLRRRRRRRIARLSVLGVIALVLLGAVGGLAVADRAASDTIADGISVNGVDVGGLTKRAALQRLDERIGTPTRRPVTVRVGSRTAELTADGAGVRIDLDRAVDDALAAGRDGNFLKRGWRAVTGGRVHSDVRAEVAVDRRAVRDFVDGLEKQVAKPAVNAELSVSVAEVAVTPGRNGRTLTGAGKLERRIVRAFRAPDADRSLKAKTAPVAPKVTEKDVWAANPTIVTVDHDAHTVRVFEEGDVAATYKVAVGEPKYPTPKGRFTVQTMQKDPIWNVPDSDWAGDLAGETIPSGDPRNPLVARWIGFSGAVGFHGTKDLGSLGSRASHGCVRMNPKDVIDLFDRVQVGTTVLVA